MTPAQTKRLQVITNMMCRYYDNVFNSARLDFHIIALSKDAVMLCASNSVELPWYETHYSAYVVIEKQGGISRYSGSMRPKLVLPVTPRLCEYQDPFKRTTKEL